MKLSIHIGYGEIKGHISQDSTQETHSYKITGPVTSMTLAYQINKVSLNLNYQSIVGIASQKELEHNTAWTFTLINLGIGWSFF